MFIKNNDCKAINEIKSNLLKKNPCILKPVNIKIIYVIGI